MPQKSLAKRPTGGVKALPKHKSNPFMSDVTYKRGVRRTVVKGGKAIIDEKTGEVEGVAEIVQQVDVDAERFVKLYTSDLKTFFSLSLTAQRFLRVVLEQVQNTPQSDRITLSVPLVVDYFERHKEKPPARQTIYNAVQEMVLKGFLARSELYTDQYFINPSIFFNGDRVRLVKEYRIQHQRDLLDAIPPRQMDIEEFT